MYKSFVHKLKERKHYQPFITGLVIGSLVILFFFACAAIFQRRRTNEHIKQVIERHRAAQAAAVDLTGSGPEDDRQN